MFSWNNILIAPITLDVALAIYIFDIYDGCYSMISFLTLYYLQKYWCHVVNGLSVGSTYWSIIFDTRILCLDHRGEKEKNNNNLFLLDELLW